MGTDGHRREQQRGEHQVARRVAASGRPAGSTARACRRPASRRRAAGPAARRARRPGAASTHRERQGQRHAHEGDGHLGAVGAGRGQRRTTAAANGGREVEQVARRAGVDLVGVVVHQVAGHLVRHRVLGQAAPQQARRRPPRPARWPRTTCAAGAGAPASVVTGRSRVVGGSVQATTSPAASISSCGVAKGDRHVEALDAGPARAVGAAARRGRRRRRRPDRRLASAHTSSTSDRSHARARSSTASVAASSGPVVTAIGRPAGRATRPARWRRRCPATATAGTTTEPGSRVGNARATHRPATPGSAATRPPAGRAAERSAHDAGRGHRHVVAAGSGSASAPDRAR